MQRYYPPILLLLASVFTFSVSGCSIFNPGAQSRIALGTIVQINLYEKGSQRLYDRVFERIAELENIFSTNIEGSDIDRVNQNAGIMPVRVRQELITVLDSAILFAERSGELFDPTIGTLVKLWDISGENPRLPDEEEIQSALQQINFRNLIINREESTVFLMQTGMSLDLGGIAKGYIADEIVLLLRNAGIEQALINLGGDIYVMGSRNGEYWRIGIQDPNDMYGTAAAVLYLQNKCIVSSGTYERFFEYEGIRYHHIFSLETGYPVVNDLLSVSIISENCMEADALSTAVFTLGFERGTELIKSIPGTEGIFIFDDYTIRLTPGIEIDFLEGRFIILNSDYRVILQETL